MSVDWRNDEINLKILYSYKESIDAEIYKPASMLN